MRADASPVGDSLISSMSRVSAGQFMCDMSRPAALGGSAAGRLHPFRRVLYNRGNSRCTAEFTRITSWRRERWPDMPRGRGACHRPGDCGTGRAGGSAPKPPKAATDRRSEVNVKVKTLRATTNVAARTDTRRTSRSTAQPATYRQQPQHPQSEIDSTPICCTYVPSTGICRRIF